MGNLILPLRVRGPDRHLSYALCLSAMGSLNLERPRYLSPFHLGAAKPLR